MYRRFYAPPENFTLKNVTLDADETKHLRDVLRLRVNERVKIFDGAGREFLAVIENIAKRSTVLRIVETCPPNAPSSPLDLTLAVALLKGEKFDLVVQKAVELGVKRLIPLATKRADVKLKDSAKKPERWRRIALEAAKQSGRADLMSVEQSADFKRFIAEQKDEKSELILFAERGGESLSLKKTDKIIAVVGAEGGWEDEEIEAARKNDWKIVTFGGRILRFNSLYQFKPGNGGNRGRRRFTKSFRRF